ncbi:MAG TPA: AMP nucleosidase, partial [Tistrella mobilis]|nr:AMP nucleosidase [Tistrella mobilis]
NYQFYVDEFCRMASELLADGDSGYESFVAPGNLVTRAGETGRGLALPDGKLPQMPAYHLTRADQSGITLVNIG